MGKYVAYPAYKDSGIEWLGKVPEHWDSVALRWISKRFSGGTPDKTNGDYWSEGTIPWLNSGAVNQQIITTSSAYISLDALENSSAKWVPEKAVLIALAGQGKTKGMAAYTTFPTTCNQSMAAVVFEEYNPKFMFWWLTSQYKNIRGLASDDARDGLNLEMIGSIPCPIFDKYEQQQIADFLDDKTAHLDKLIGQKQQMIVLLNEKRMALITQAVTKGLDLSVPMKDSGVEWLGDIPEHWNVLPLKAFLNDIAGSIKTGPFGSQLKSADMSKEGIKVYNQKNVITGDFNSGFDFISEEKYNELSSFEIFPEDLLVTTRGTIGRCAIFPHGIEKGVLHPCLMRLQFKKNKLLNHFFVKLMQETKILLEQLTLKSNATTIEVIYTDTLKNLIIAVPPVFEQQQIANYLNTETQKIDDMITTVKQAIATLQEYRTALITAAVTGKIDVRGFK
ncbi:MAG: restriction endonuclease subunit S [Methylococcales bacterium]|nr:restriction endonuclease subunit S [Methylococcales bacterium]